MKKTFKLLFILSLIAMLSACGSTNYSNQTLVGRISEINGNTITIELGDVEENEQSQQVNGDVPQLQNEAPQFQQNGTPPEMNGERPEMPSSNETGPNGDVPQFQGEAPQFSEGEELPEPKGEAPQFQQNGTPPEMNGERPEMPSSNETGPNGDVPQFQGENRGMFQSINNSKSSKTYTFTPSGETLKVDLQSVGTTFDELNEKLPIKVGSVVKISIDSNNSIKNIKLYTINNELDYVS